MGFDAESEARLLNELHKGFRNDKKHESSHSPVGTDEESRTGLVQELCRLPLDEIRKSAAAMSGATNNETVMKSFPTGDEKKGVVTFTGPCYVMDMEVDPITKKPLTKLAHTYLNLQQLCGTGVQSHLERGAGQTGRFTPEDPVDPPETKNRFTPEDRVDPPETISKQPACNSYNPQDPYSLDARFENTENVAPENRGKCVDTSLKRPIHILSPQEVADLHLPPAAPGEMIVANFSHNFKPYIARFPADGVSEVIVQRELYNPGSSANQADADVAAVYNRLITEGPAHERLKQLMTDLDKLNMEYGYSAHLQVRFEFNKPGKEVVLVPQDNPTNMSKAIKIHHVVASGEGTLREEKGDSFDLIKGMHGHFCFTRRLASLQEKYEEMVIDNKHYVQQWRIKPVVNKNVPIDGKISTADLMRQEYLKSALNLSDNDYKSYKAGHPVMYDTIDRSCVTGGFEVFDQANHYSHPIPQYVGAPIFIPDKLVDRDMMDRQQPDLKTEIESRRSFNW
jgi:hypothetical protein